MLFNRKGWRFPVGGVLTNNFKDLEKAQGFAPAEGTALAELCRLAYPELKRLAHVRLRRLGGHSILDTTGLVNEAYTRMAAAGRFNFGDRSQFFAYSAQVIRSIIVDLAREAGAIRHGGGLLRITYSPDLRDGLYGEQDPVRVSDALCELAKVEPRLALVVEMRFFAGCTEREIAEALTINERTVRRDWGRAKVLLHAMLTG